MDYLKKEELEVGVPYKVHARNFNEAVWNGKAFTGMREKFGDRYEFDEYHWDDGAPFGTVKPLEKLKGIS